MKIGINCQNLSELHFAGVENYTVNLLSSLLNIDKENQYVLYFDKEPYKNLSDFLGGFPNCKIVVLRKYGSWTQISLAFHLLTNPVSVYFTPIHTLPIIAVPFINSVAMIHGLEYKYSPKRGLFGFFRGWHEWFVIRMSKKLVVPSEFTKNQILVEIPHLPAQKIHVIPEGVSNYFSKERKSKDTHNHVSKLFQLKEKYLLFVSTIQPRKNISTLVRAFAKIKRDMKYQDIDLAIAGKKGWDYDEELVLPIRLGINDSVKFLGRVNDQELPYLYMCSSGFVSTSKMEGFGLHLLEAMRAGVPCAVSDIPSYKEIGKDTVLYHSPEDEAQVQKNMRTILEDSEYVESLKLRAYARSLLFYWDKTALETLEVFKSLANIPTK